MTDRKQSHMHDGAPPRGGAWPALVICVHWAFRTATRPHVIVETCTGSPTEHTASASEHRRWRRRNL
jgi:hypothetical protein